MVEIRLGQNSPAIGQRIMDLKVPAGALIVLVGRDGKTFVPTANTELVAEDTLLVLAEPKGAADLRATCLGIHV
jgi:Trk K+ transport system NAD-binding subunit